LSRLRAFAVTAADAVASSVFLCRLFGLRVFGPSWSFPRGCVSAWLRGL